MAIDKASEISDGIIRYPLLSVTGGTLILFAAQFPHLTSKKG
jgi:hypothetical protein